MLGKLIKHEFRATGRVMLPLLLALVVLAVLASVSFTLLDHCGNGFVSLLLGLLIAAYFICVFAVGIIVIVIVVERFYHNLMGDQGYVMMTLPTDAHALVWSKLIVSLVWVVVSALAIMLTLILAGVTVMGMESIDIAAELSQLPPLGVILDRICLETGLSKAGLVGMGFEFMLIVILGSLATFLHFYAAMSIGHSFAKNKVLLSIVFYVVISIALQIFSGAATVLTGMSVEHVMGEMGFGFFAYMLHFLLALIAAQGALLYLATVLPLKKGLNLA